MTMVDSSHVHIDAPSKSGQFGWELINQTLGISIPVVLRNETRYSPVKIVEQEIIKRYEKLHPEVFKCINLNSYYMTQAEAQLLNIINTTHCDHRYGNESFDTKDVLISVSDIRQLAKFFLTTEALYEKGISEIQNKHIGMVKIFYDNHKKPALVPYVLKSYNTNFIKFVSTIVAEMISIPSDACIRAEMTAWDMTYMKMLCMYSDNGFKDSIDSDKTLVSVDGLASFNNAPLTYQIWQGPGDDS